MASEIKVDTIVNAGGDNDTGIDLSTNDVVKFDIAGAEKARVHSDGKVGIGETTPLANLHIKSADSGVTPSADSDELAEAMKNSDQWKPKVCRDYAIENFNSKKMALKYLEIYERVIDGEVLNDSIPTLQKPEPKLLPFK